jgi:hypothetical protein
MTALRQLIIGTAWLLIANASAAQSVWHCSRQADLGPLVGDSAQAGQPADDGDFQIASMSANSDVIGVTLRDLVDVYAGMPVRIGGRPLTACFNSDNDPSSEQALSSLGLNTNAMSALARKSAIVRSQLIWVSNQEDMMHCISRNFPAVGYFANPKDTSEVSPCF